MTKLRAYNTKAMKISGSQAREMYERLKSGEINQREAAEIYGLGVIQVGRIARGESRAQETGARLNPIPNFNLQPLTEEQSMAETRRRLEAEPEAPTAEAPKGSWYDQPPPYEEHEMAPETQAKLDKTLNTVKPSFSARVGDELGKLEKGD